jgi:hypothetical protein
MAQRLTVAVVTKRLVSALEAIGFVRIKGRNPKLVKKLNDETEIFLYPGVSRRGSEIVVDPVIGVENVTLRARLLSADRDRWKGCTRVCHKYLGLMDDWIRLYLKTEDGLDAVASQVVQSVIRFGLPEMSIYGARDKVIKLFEEDLANTKRSTVAVVFAKDKLEALRRH